MDNQGSGTMHLFQQIENKFRASARPQCGKQRANLPIHIGCQELKGIDVLESAVAYFILNIRRNKQLHHPATLRLMLHCRREAEWICNLA